MSAQFQWYDIEEKLTCVIFVRFYVPFYVTKLSITAGKTR